MNKKYIKIIVIVFFVGVAGLLFCYSGDDSNTDSLTLENTCDSEVEKSDEDEERASKDLSSEYEKDESVSKKVERLTVFVHVCGEVNKPGVYEVSSTARVIDVIKAAGGLTNKAAGDYVNQAMLISDSQQVYIPSKKEIEDGTIQKSSTIQNKDESTTVSSENDSSKVNINTASKTELMTLPGIGEQKANSIIEYRAANGNFNNIEEVKNVSGVKDGLFSKISKYIVVD